MATIGDGRCRQHAHSYPLDLVDNEVPKAHPVVPHHEGHGSDDGAGVLVVESEVRRGELQVLFDAGNTLLRVDVGVHAERVVCEY